MNDSLWARLKEEVFKKHGTLRRLSDEVEEILRTALIEEALPEAFGLLGLKVTEVTSEEVKRGRPRVRGPVAQEIVREMRLRRAKETLSRQ